MSEFAVQQGTAMETYGFKANPYLPSCSLNYPSIGSKKWEWTGMHSLPIFPQGCTACQYFPKVHNKFSSLVCVLISRYLTDPLLRWQISAPKQLFPAKLAALGHVQAPTNSIPTLSPAQPQSEGLNQRWLFPTLPSRTWSTSQRACPLSVEWPICPLLPTQLPSQSIRIDLADAPWLSEAFPFCPADTSINHSSKVCVHSVGRAWENLPVAFWAPMVKEYSIRNWNQEYVIPLITGSFRALLTWQTPNYRKGFQIMTIYNIHKDTLAIIINRERRVAWGGHRGCKVTPPQTEKS